MKRNSIIFSLLAMLMVGISFVSCTDNDDKEQEFEPSQGEQSEPGDYRWVDLGLPSGTLWATCNIGANSPEEYGDYYAWGETTPKSKYGSSTYKFGNTRYSMTKYCTSSSDGIVDNKTELDPADDAATVNWGSNWQMPSDAQFLELINNNYTDAICTTVKGVYGWMIISKKNKNCIFLPAAGARIETSPNGQTWLNNYWSRSLGSSGTSYNAFGLFSDRSHISTSYGDRPSGRSVRPVRKNQSNPPVLDVSLLIGSWKTTFEGNEYSILTFKEDKTFTNSGVGGGESYYDTGTWSFNTNTKILTLTYSDGSKNDGEIVKLTATELVFPDCIYLRIDNNSDIDNPNGNETNITGTIQGHDYVDLGLPSGTLWATMNVGAKEPEGYGDVFAWGETETDWFYHWNTYKYSNGSGSTLTKYCVNSSYGTVDNKTELEPADDAATANWGSDWRMPSRAQFEELINNNNTTTSWTSLNGVDGTMIISKRNGMKMFLPAAGFGLGHTLTLPGSYGCYSSRTLNTNNSQQNIYLFTQKSDINIDNDLRCYGQSIRPIVRRNNPVGTVTVTITRAAEPEAITCTLHGSVSGINEIGEDVEVGFIYSSKSIPSESYGKKVKTTSKGDFSLTLKGVLDDQTYYYRAYALVDDVYYLSDVKEFTTEQLTYELDGVTYKFIKVEGGDMPPFSIMQTEYPCTGPHTVKFLGVDYGSIDGGLFGNKDGTVITTEFRSFWYKIKRALGLPIRLPHRTEWVYAASGGAKSHGYSYSGSDVIDNVAWYKGNSEGGSHPVAMKQPNELGLYDMSGNYAELCFKEGNLTGTNADTTFIDGPYCGGSWKNVADDCKVTSWKEGEMGGTVSGTRISEKNAFDSSFIGLRLVYSRNDE